MPFGVGRAIRGRPQDDDDMGAVSRAAHLAMLARPFPRQLQPYPNPKLVKPFPMKIPASVLVYKPTKRVLLLSKYKTGGYTPKYVKPPPAEHYVHPESLTFVPSKRILELAKRSPKKKEKVSKKKRRDLKRQKMRAKRFAQKRPEWLATKAAPKKRPPSPKPPKPKPRKGYKAMSAEEKEEHLKVLARPKPEPPSNVREDYCKVSKAAQLYEPSERILELYLPKQLAEEAILDLTFNPFKIKAAALRYVATDRMKQLAVPNVRKQAVDTDVKENPFSVLPRALKAKCSKRTAELAKPIQRD